MNVIPITWENFDAEMDKKAEEKARLICISGLDTGERTMEVNYHFVINNGDVVTLRLTRGIKEEFKSVVDKFPAAVLVEKELVEMYGIEMKGVEGHLLLAADADIYTPQRRSP